VDDDGVKDIFDNCPETRNPDQDDTDLDGIGDWCDNCRFVANADQDATACGGGDNSGNYSINPPDNQPNPSYGTEYTGQDYVRGSGGCSLGNATSGIPWGALAIFASAMAVVLRRRRS